MPIQLIAMDIDGTLLDSRARLPEENARAIAEAAARGIEIVIVTGRRFDFARSTAEALAGDLHLIVNNGALIKSKSGATHYRMLLPVAVARQALDATPGFWREAAVVFDRSAKNQLFFAHVDFDDPVRGPYFRRNREFIAEASPLTACLNGEDPIQVMYAGPCATIRAAMRALEALPLAGEFSLSLAEYEHRNLSILDVLQRGVTKGAGLREWARQRGIPRENVMAIGDNWNDREMLEFAGLPIVMANSVAELKSRGWRVTLSNDECGVAHAIRAYALNGLDRGTGAS